MLTFKRIDLETWGQEIGQYADYMAYQTPVWLKFIAATQGAEPVVAALKSGTRTVGHFTGLVVTKWGLRILGSPFPGWASSYMGFCLSARVSHGQAIEALIPFAFKNLRCVHLEMMDRIVQPTTLTALACQYELQTSYEIDLRPDADTLLRNMSRSCRWNIGKAARSGVVIEEAQDASFAQDYYDQLVDVFAKQSLVPTYDLRRVQALIQHLRATEMLLLLRARNTEGRCVATGIFLAAGQTMHLWGAASWRADQHLRPNEAIQWYAMTYWKARGMCRYDMGGGGGYKRRYGGREIDVPWFRKAKYRPLLGLRRMAQQMVAAQQRLLGATKS